MVVVQSGRYGSHIRAVRGSVKPAPINDVLLAQAENTASVNQAAKQVHDLLKQYSGAFKESHLWQALLSRMRKAVAAKPFDRLMGVKGLEVNSKYPLERFGQVPAVAVEVTSKNMRITVNSNDKPSLTKGDNSYCYEAILFLFNSKAKAVSHATAVTAWFDKKTATGKQVLPFTKAKNAMYYMVCLHIQGGHDSIASGNLASRGMQVVTVGKVE